jgi:hypothetical protein
MLGWSDKKMALETGGNKQENVKKDNNDLPSSEPVNPQNRGIVFTRCYHNVPHPAANNASTLPRHPQPGTRTPANPAPETLPTPLCSLCLIDKRCEENKAEENVAFEKLKIKMKKDEKNKRVTIYYINNNYVRLSVKIPKQMVQQHQQFAYCLQTFIQLLVVFILSIFLLYVLSLCIDILVAYHATTPCNDTTL